MLMVLMALLELGRSKVGKATRWLWLLLSGGLWLGQEGCELPQATYGVPADFITDRDVPDAQQPDAAATDVPAQDPASVDVPQVPDVQADCPPMTYYGPQPCESDADCVQREGPGWYCDTANVYADGCGGEIPYALCRPGDVPVDAVTPDVPSDTPPECEPMIAYGPPPCTTDADCQSWGEGWICDKAHPITDPCHDGSWYMCAEGPAPTDVIPGDAPVDAVAPDTLVDLPEDSPPVTYYGPQPTAPKTP